MDDAAWQRAHSPEQKAERRGAILDAAAALFRERPIAAISIGEVAQRAGLAKGSVYRYFATKEEVFLDLLVRELDGWFDALGPALAPLAALTSTERAGDPQALAARLVETLRPRETMLRLLSRLFSDIEENLSLEAVRAFKRWLLERVGPAGAAIEAALPSLPAGAGARVVLRLNALVAGLWPMASPAGNTKKVLSTPRMAPLRVDFFPELEAALGAMLAGMAAAPPAARKASRGSRRAPQERTS